MPDIDLGAIKKRAQEARKRAEKATEGPWKTCPDDSRESIPLVCLGNPDEHSALMWTWSDDDGVATLTWEDAEFISNTRTDVPEMANDIDTLIAEIERLEGNTRAWEASHGFLDTPVTPKRDR